MKNPFPTPHKLRRLQIEITTGCNLECRGCLRTIGMARGTWVNKHMSPSKFAKILDHLPPSSALNLQGIGEPTLHPKLEELITIAKKTGKYDIIGFNSNGLVRDIDYYKRLCDLGLGYVAISVDSFSGDVAEFVRAGTDVALLRQRLTELLNLRPQILVNVSIVVSRWNMNELHDLLRDLVEIGIGSVELQSLIAYDEASREGGLRQSDAEQVQWVVADIRRDYPDLSIFLSGFETTGWRCNRPLVDPYVTVDGYLTPCAATEDIDEYGKISMLEHDFAAAWSSPSIAGWLARYVGAPPEMCRNCCFNPSRVLPV